VSGALVLVEAVAFDIIVVGYPLPDHSAEELLEVVRREGSPCRRSAVLLLAAEDRVDEIEPLCGNGFTRAVAAGASREVLHDVVSSLLRVAPRLSLRLSIRLEVELEEGRTVALSQTENVSKGGILVRSRRLYPIETGVRFELFLPDEEDSIVGTGLIVHHTQGLKGTIRGFGVKFITFQNDCEERLTVFVSSRLEASSKTSLFPGIGTSR
jgi:hypothetical protein